MTKAKRKSEEQRVASLAPKPVSLRTTMQLVRQWRSKELKDFEKTEILTELRNRQVIE